MTALISRRLLFLLLPVSAAVLGCVAFSSCSSSKNKPQGGANGAYASYPADGHYNPYPTGGSQGATSHYQEYTEAPPPPETKSKAKAKTKTSVAAVSSEPESSAAGKKPTKKKSTVTSKTASTKSGTTKSATSKSTGSGTVHVVKKGDSLYSLAKKYHTTVSKIKSANGLSSDLIRDGQKLKIP
jgi:LysM repeat protein